MVLPGSGTCMRVSGYVNAQAAFGTLSNSRQIRAQTP
jgi:hypothetical protein